MRGKIFPVRGRPYRGWLAALAIAAAAWSCPVVTGQTVQAQTGGASPSPGLSGPVPLPAGAVAADSGNSAIVDPSVQPAGCSSCGGGALCALRLGRAPAGGGVGGCVSGGAV